MSLLEESAKENKPFIFQSTGTGKQGAGAEASTAAAGAPAKPGGKEGGEGSLQEAGRKVPVGGAAVQQPLQRSSSSASASSSSCSSAGFSCLPGATKSTTNPVNSPLIAPQGKVVISSGSSSNQAGDQGKQKSGSTSAESSTGGSVNRNSSINKPGKQSAGSKRVVSPSGQEPSGQEPSSRLVKEGDTLVRVRIKSGSCDRQHGSTGQNPPSPSHDPSDSSRSLSRGSILATKMAESHHSSSQSVTGWSNSKDDYELGEVIGTKLHWFLVSS